LIELALRVSSRTKPTAKLYALTPRRSSSKKKSLKESLDHADFEEPKESKESKEFRDVMEILALEDHEG
jgi:hypothetical protein